MDYNLTYLPTELINSKYKYTLSDGVIRVITNNNCYQNYNSTYCDCYDVFLNNDYMVSNVINCNNAPTNYVTSVRFTDDYYYRKDISDILLTFLIIIIIGFGIPLALILRFFKKGR